MGSSFFGRPNMRGSSPSSPSSSSPTSSSSSPATRRGKKNGSEKQKQPQRGLGVAQLEKIRLHGEMSCNSFNNYNTSLYHQVTFHVHCTYIIFRHITQWFILKPSPYHILGFRSGRSSKVFHFYVIGSFKGTPINFLLIVPYENFE